MIFKQRTTTFCVFATVLCLILTATVTGTELADRYFSLSFGSDRLTTSLGSTSSLTRALDHEVIQSQSTDSSFLNRLGCAAYEDGLAAASAYRDVEAILLTPFYVNAEEDALCFIVRTSTDDDKNDEIPLLDMVAGIPSPLKVEQSVFDVLDILEGAESCADTPNPPLAADIASVRASTEEAKDFQLSAFTYPTLSGDDIDDIMRGLSDKIEEKLSDYAFGTFSEFYWKLSEEEKDDAPPGELERVLEWDHRVDSLQSALAACGNTGNDPCSYGSLQYTVTDDTLSISISSLLTIPDGNLSAACIAHVTSELASNEGVSFVSLSTRPELLNYRARSIQQSGAVGASNQYAPYTAAGLKGKDQVVGVADTGLDEYSCYFHDANGRVERSLYHSPVTDTGRRKVVQYTRLPEADDTDLTNGHGTHVAGTVAGNNGESIQGDGIMNGVAPEAKIAFMDLGTPRGALYAPGINEAYPNMRKAGAVIYTNSWGATFSGSGYYVGKSMDAYLYENMDSILFFANGNSGSRGAGSLTREASSKNVVGVGAGETSFNSQSIENVAYFSSQGPAYDGRIKPELIAPGNAVVSARSSKQGTNDKTCQTMAKSGTSMASPAAAGSAALVRQYFTDSGFWNTMCQNRDAFCKCFTPSGVLIKAILIHSGHGLSKFHGGGSKDRALDSPPDNYQGFGRIMLQNVLPLAGHYKFLLYVRDMVNIAENKILLYKIRVKSSSRPLKATLSWYDPPGTSGSSKALIHDLDLVLEAPGGNTMYYANGGNTYDRINNNEQVVVPSPATGRWKVYVRAGGLPYSGSQKFSLVVTCTGRAITKGKGKSVGSLDVTENNELEGDDEEDDEEDDEVANDDIEDLPEPLSQYDSIDADTPEDVSEGEGRDVIRSLLSRLSRLLGII